jgi:hypothetical protein
MPSKAATTPSNLPSARELEQGRANSKLTLQEALRLLDRANCFLAKLMQKLQRRKKKANTADKANVRLMFLFRFVAAPVFLTLTAHLQRKVKDGQRNESIGESGATHTGCQH